MMLFKSIFTLFSLLSLVSCFALFPRQNEKRDDILSTFFNPPDQTEDIPPPPEPTTASSTTNTAAEVTSIPNIASFYGDFISYRYSYVNEHQTYFRTHSFSNLGTLSSEFSALMTFTDGQFSTFLAANPSLTQLLASVAPQFPWYSSWYEENVARARETGAANAAVSSVNVPIFNSKGKMGFLTTQVAVLFTTLILVTFWY